MKRFPFVVFLTCSACVLRAQFNDSVTHHLRFSASGNLNRSNNSTAYLLNNDARFSIRNKRTTLNTAASWLYGEQGSNLTNNDFTATADFNFYRDSSNLYYWALAHYTTSYALRINNQLQSGAGAAYNFVNTASAWLNLSEGILYETSSLNSSNATVDRYHTVRNSLRLSYKFVLQRVVTVSGANFFQPAFGNGDDYIVRTSNALTLQLNSWLAISSSLTYNKVNRTGTENMLFTYGLVVEKYF